MGVEILFYDSRGKIQSMSRNIPPIALSLAAVALVGISLFILSWSAPIITPILLAWYLTALALPGYFWLQKRGLRKGIALILLIFIILVGGVTIGLLFILALNSLQAGLSLYLDNLDAFAESVTAALDVESQSGTIVDWLGSNGLGQILINLLPALIDAATSFLFSLVLVAFLLLEAPRFQRLLNTVLSDRPVFSQMPTLMKTAVTYFGIRTRLNLITGLGFTFWLILLGVDYAPLWGLLTFVLSYIPYIGLFTAMIPPTILALAEFGLVRGALVVAGAVAFNLLVENVLEPSYTGKKLRLSPSIVFISFFVWGWLLGPVGALLSMPITVMLMLVLDQHESTRWIANIIGRE
jgi:predicted PurR-regulated permease PerM